jgi:D-alanyl-lipoteichoic acid acyltransferase DltB (MBOAT superfamily)
MTPAINWEYFSYLWTYDPTQPLIFSTLAFFVWFLAFYTIYLLLLKQFNLRILYTILFSWFFYYKSSGWYLSLIIISTVFDFGMGHLIYNARTRRLQGFFLFLSLAFNLGILGYFKYTNFLISSANSLFGYQYSTLDIILPAGISFFTFQTLSYSIDVYRRHIVPLSQNVKDVRSFFRELMDFAFFVSFFPQLVAGPIVRAVDFLPQIRKKPVLTNELLGRALLLIMSGLFKKTVISDYISVNYVDRIFENPSLYSGLENLLGVYGYAIQIYCDFSGYSDMAIGIALLLGFRLPDNFHTPYRSESVQDFWRRWHISLSSWLRDYLYISLGGNRNGGFRTYLNLTITMLLGGLWHGASWVFIVWGGLHGAALAVDRWLSSLGKVWKNNLALRSFIILFLVQLGLEGLLWQQFISLQIEETVFRNLSWSNLLVLSFNLMLTLLASVIDLATRRQFFSKGVSTFFVFHFVTFCWVFFRAGALNNPNPPLETVGSIFGQIAGAFHPELWQQLWQGYPQVIGLIALGYVLHFLPDRLYALLDGLFIKAPLVLKSLVLAAVIWLVIQTSSSEIVPFIYFQF